MSEYLEDYKKMKILREVALKIPGGHLEHIIKTIDEIWEREFKKMTPSKRKTFVTKF